MNNPNPFVPKGSILELQSKRRSRLKLAVFCVLAVSVAGLSVLLIEGCKRETPVEPADAGTPTIDTNLSMTTETNPPAQDTNVYAPPPYTSPAPYVAEQLPVPAAGTEYTVVKGDVLDTIAKKNGVTVKALEAANPGVVPTKLKIGQKLAIPAGNAAAPAVMGSNANGAGEAGQVYVVKSGDNLTKIAKHFGTTVKAIQSNNNLNTAAIKVGQKLKIPTKGAGTAAGAPAVDQSYMAPPPVTPADTTPPK